MTLRTATLASFALLPLLAGVAEAGPRAVVELFTSQGCAACPPADKLARQLDAETDDVIVLSMPVSIWDYLGWSDTLALPELTERQRAYAVARGDHDIYTPQAVINGRVDVTGSDREAILAAIDEDNADGPALAVDVSVTRVGDVIRIAIGDAPRRIARKGAEVWLGIVEVAVSVPVKGGENRGRKLAYHNVVRSLRPVGIWRGKELVLEIPIGSDMARTGTAAVVLLQSKRHNGPGPIIGAAMLEEIHASRAVAMPGSAN